MERNHAAATRRLGERCRPRGRRRFRTRRGGRWFDAGASPGGLASLTAVEEWSLTYIDGFVVPVPAGKKEAYRAMAARAVPMYKEHGATLLDG